MYEAVMIAAAGITSQQRRIDTIADNIANLNTSGYKSSRLDFKDALYTAGVVPGPPRTPDGNQQKGHGTLVASITRDFVTGSLYNTGKDLDVAIEGEGFFELADNNGNIIYSRNGSFTLANNGGGFYLVNSSGYYVHDDEGMNIQVPEDTSKIEIGEDGVIRFLNGDEETLAEAKLGVYTFRNIMGLTAVGGGNYAESALTGEKLPAEGAVIRQSTLEGSNVNLAEEMTRLIRTQRAFSLASRALTTADEMEGIANNMKR